MNALGLIETRGLLAAIECADVMLKTAQVELMGRTFVGGGLVTIAIMGDVGAVKASVESGAAAVEALGRLFLVSQHVIPRPHHDIESVVTVKVEPTNKQATAVLQPEKTSIHPAPITLKPSRKADVDDFVQRVGLEEVVGALKTLSVVKLRNLAREYKELDLAGRAISKANKELLIQKLKEYYEKATKH